MCTCICMKVCGQERESKVKQVRRKRKRRMLKNIYSYLCSKANYLCKTPAHLTRAAPLTTKYLGSPPSTCLSLFGTYLQDFHFTQFYRTNNLALLGHRARGALAYVSCSTTGHQELPLAPRHGKGKKSPTLSTGAEGWRVY